jgi:hypothetical protein
MADSSMANGLNGSDSDSSDGKIYPPSSSTRTRVVVVGLGMVGIAFM